MMARRVPLHDVGTIIKIIEQDGGVILTGFSSIADVEKVNRDAAPFITALKAEVSLNSTSEPITSLADWGAFCAL